MTCICLTLATIASVLAPVDPPSQPGIESCLRRPAVQLVELTDEQIEARLNQQRRTLDSGLLLMNRYESYLKDPQMTLKPVRHV